MPIIRVFDPPQHLEPVIDGDHAPLISEKSRACFQDRFCLFSPNDWCSLEVNIDDLRSICSVDHSNRHGHDFSRYVVVGRLLDGQIGFYSASDCPVRIASIIDDYDDAIISNNSLMCLIDILKEIGPKIIMANPSLRVLVEIISRRDEVPAPLLPHEDGRACLFFLALDNTMEGGDMKLFRSRRPLCVEKPKMELRGSKFYSEDDMDLLHVVPCVSGAGYFVYEHSPSDRLPVLHGCNGWVRPGGTAGVRNTLRITFSIRSSVDIQ